MATPIYNAARGYRGHQYGGGRNYGRGRIWAWFMGSNSMLGSNTPQYLGTGQPVKDSDSLFGDGTPVYRTVPSTSTTATAETAPCMTASDTTPQPPAPQPGQMAIVVPRL